MELCNSSCGRPDMGYQLWASPITGYRRRGTRLRDFRAALAAKITAYEIFEPLLSCPSHAPASDMLMELTRRDFDVAGVRSDPDSPVSGFVKRTNLTSGLVQEHKEKIPQDEVIDPADTIEQLLDQLRNRRYLFVRLDEAISGIVTLADLNKPLVRVYLFGLISLLEIHMSFWVAQEFPKDTWKSVIGAGRLAKAESTQAQRRERGQDLSLSDCLQFADKRDLIVGCDRLRGNLDLGSKEAATRCLRNAEDLRNTLAHSQYDLVEGSTWSDLIELVLWMRSLIATSDDSVDQHVAEGAHGYIGALW